MKKILVISNMYPSDLNVRYGIFVKNFYNSLKSEFILNKIVLTYSENLIFKIIKYVTFYIKLIYKSLNESFDLVYVHYPLFVSPILYFFYRDKKIILNFHGTDISFKGFHRQVLGFFLLKVIHRAERIVVPSYYFKEKIKTKFSIEDSDVFVYPSGGVDKSKFSFLEKSELRNSPPVLGFISNFISSKGWKDYLDIFIQADYEKIELRGIMIGNGIDKNKIEKYISDNKINVQVISNLPQDKLYKYYQLFDVFIYPTKNDSLGLVGLESMMCGTPIITTDDVGPSSYVDHAINGFKYSSRNPGELFKLVKDYFNLDILERKKISNNAFLKALDYSSEKSRDNIVNFLKKCP